MPSLRIHRDNASLPHFITLTTNHWYYLFDRDNRWHILEKALTYQITHHELKVYAYIFMLNHVHLIASAPDLINGIRDFKKFTTYQMKESIMHHEPHLLAILLDENKRFRLWQLTNMPIVLESQSVVNQKIDYIHNNPVKKQYVMHPEHWYWSSANPDTSIQVAAL